MGSVLRAGDIFFYTQHVGNNLIDIAHELKGNGLKLFEKWVIFSSETYQILPIRR